MSAFNKTKVDLEFAEKLRKEHPLQFVTLIRMHLSFLLDLNLTAEEIEADQTDKTKSKKGWLFPKKKGSICTTAHTKSPDGPPQMLSEPMIEQLNILMDFLKNNENLCQEGIFRKTGSVSRQQELKFLINQLKPVNLDDFTAHDVASVLKSILADLPEPLLTDVYFPAYSQVADICNMKENDEKSRIVNSLQLLLLLLPHENRVVLENLIILLNNTSKLEARNKMNADTLATLFTPHLICPKKLPPEALHQTAATMTRMVSFIISHVSIVFLVPEKLSTDIRAYLIEQKRRRETPEKILDESTSESVANTVFTFVDREKTAEAHVSNSTDTALAQLYAHIQQLPESSKKKKLIKQFNKQNGQGTPLQFLSRDKASSSACRSIGTIKNIFHKTLHKTPKRGANNTPSSTTVTRTPMGVAQTNPNKRILFQSPVCTTKNSLIIPELKPPQPIAIISQSLASPKPLIIETPCALSKPSGCDLSSDIMMDDTPAITLATGTLVNISEDDMLDDEDFCSSDEDDIDDEPRAEMNLDEMEHKAIIATTSHKKPSLFRSRLMKGVSLGNLKFPFHSPSSSATTATPQTPTLKKSKSSSILIDMEKDDEKRKFLGAESFDSEESDLFFSMDHTKESWYVDVSNINYFLNQTEAHDNNLGMRNSMSPITKSTQRMPKSMQESIMTPRSRKPVISYQANISELLEESEEMPTESSQSASSSPQSSGDIPLNSLQINKLRSKSESDILAANDNGLPVVDIAFPNDGSSSSAPETLSNAFRDYLYTRGNITYNTNQDDVSSSTLDEFESSTEYQKLEESKEISISPQHEDIENILNASNMSDTLMYCLDGNASMSQSPNTRKRLLDYSAGEESLDSAKKPLIDSTDL